MLFVSYWFVAFCAVFFPLYWLASNGTARRLLLIAFSALFYFNFAGAAGFAPLLVLGLATYFAGISGRRSVQLWAIGISVAALVFYKYTVFLADQIIGAIQPQLGHAIVNAAHSSGVLPALPPLAISFFVFEFVHYLMDVTRGDQPIRSPIQFAMFALFWPSVVSGPIKRYEQFLPAAGSGTARIDFNNIAQGFARVMLGYFKKVVLADNLTAFIGYCQPQFSKLELSQRWLVFAAIALRILLDFSGYSDIAIGLARMMGIRLPENFDWPYLASDIQEFWKRWHISLSTWIRDYVYFPLSLSAWMRDRIYVPLGGKHHGAVRNLASGMIAFTLCGLWHGAAWNFVLWGAYHGAGVAVSANYVTALGAPGRAIERFLDRTVVFKYALTLLFVMIGWLYFFYPVPEANHMLGLLFGVH